MRNAVWAILCDEGVSIFALSTHRSSVREKCFGRVLVATEVTALWRRSGDRRALRTLELLAMELRTKDSGCPMVGNSVNCQREIFHNQTCGQPTMHICGLGV